MTTNLIFTETNSGSRVAVVTGTEVSCAGPLRVRAVTRDNVPTIEAEYYDIHNLGVVRVEGSVEGNLRLIGDFKRPLAVNVSGTLTHSFD